MSNLTRPSKVLYLDTVTGKRIPKLESRQLVWLVDDCVRSNVGLQLLERSRDTTIDAMQQALYGPTKALYV